jgi:hypothetical protein
MHIPQESSEKNLLPEPSIILILGWEGLKSVGMVETHTEKNGTTKVRSLIPSFLGTIQSQYPGIKNARYDFTAGRFLDSRNVPIFGGSEQGFDKAAKSERVRFRSVAEFSSSPLYQARAAKDPTYWGNFSVRAVQ